MLNIQEALQEIEKAGIASSKQILYRWAREGRIHAILKSKKEGYQFREKDIRLFIEQYKPRNKKAESFSINHFPSNELEHLRLENEQLKYRINMPESFREAENLRLERLLKEKEEEIRALREELSSYKKFLPKK